MFAPGAGFNYSTYGYTLVALAMESVYEHSFEEIMSKEMFSPIGMTSTRFDKAGEPEAENLAMPCWGLIF